MTADAIQNTSKTFKFSFPTCTNEDVLFKLEVPVDIPYDGSTRELVQRVINMFHIPVYLEEELNEKLSAFVSEETKCFHNERDAKLLDQLKNGEINVDGIIKNWEKLFKENVSEFAEQKGTSDEEVFATAYHKLVHSPALDTILQVENSYAKTVRDTLKSRDEDIRKLTERQTEEMEDKMRTLNTFTTEEDINDLAAKHFDEQAVAYGRWGSEAEALCQAQRAHHRAWLIRTANDLHASQTLHTPTNSPLATFSPESFPAVESSAARPRLEESFTIHLGSQLKQTHNVRIVAADILDLCVLAHDDNPSESSRRLQTSLSLYSSELCGAVVLCGAESAPPRAARLTAALLNAAAASTEHHFRDAEAQLASIADKVKEPIDKRNAQRQKEHSEGANNNGGASTRFRAKRALDTGDVFITKHSNLADVHVIFHLVVDDTDRGSGDITSRHPAILGLRNILKAACSNDVTTIFLPLLLRHELTEEMTVSWCVRRAELVLKCVKGFMLEGAGGGGAQLRTLHFAAPALTDHKLFAALAALLPAVFRISNPVKFKPEDP